MEYRFKAIEDRLGNVEAKLEKVDDRLRVVETGLSTLTERVAHLPSKGFIVKSLLLCSAALGALVAFQGQIQALLHISP